MKLKLHNEYSPEKVWFAELEEQVGRKVDGSDYEVGQLEALEYTIRNQNSLIAKIIEKINPTNEELTDWLARYDEVIERVQEDGDNSGN